MPDNWLNKIRSHQATPPQGVWMHIANELDKENETEAVDLKTKMYNYQSIPPSNVLANIFATLDKDDAQATTSFNERMYNYQQEAPANAWQNIINELDKSEAKIVPLTNNKKNLKAIYFRMAAAASVIAVIATTVWFSNRNTDNPTSSNPIVSVTPEIKQPVTAEVKKENTALPASDPQEKKSTQEKTIAQTNVKKTAPLPVADNSVPNYVKGNTTNDLADNPATANKEKLQDVNGNTPNDIALMNTPNSYISVTGPDGQSVKVSAKFSNLIGYLTDNSADTKENIDVIISESAKWRKIFAGWREKMTNNSVAPSISNFMDIISLSEILEDKK
jgi:Ca2+-binding EF-hand superfamily protein